MYLIQLANGKTVVASGVPSRSHRRDHRPSKVRRPSDLPASSAGHLAHGDFQDKDYEERASLGVVASGDPSRSHRRDRRPSDLPAVSAGHLAHGEYQDTGVPSRGNRRDRQPSDLPAVSAGHLAHGDYQDEDYDDYKEHELECE